jgi:hypothetical protein
MTRYETLEAGQRAANRVLGIGDHAFKVMEQVRGALSNGDFLLKDGTTVTSAELRAMVEEAQRRSS